MFETRRSSDCREEPSNINPPRVSSPVKSNDTCTKASAVHSVASLSQQVSRAYPTVLADGESCGYGNRRSKNRRHRHDESSNHGFSDFAKIPPPSAPIGTAGMRRQDDPRIPSDLADRLAMAEQEEIRADTRRLLGDRDARPDYSEIQKKRSKAFGAKNVEVPRELLKRTRPPANIGDRAQMRRNSQATLYATPSNPSHIRPADDHSVFISVPTDVSTDTSALNPGDSREEYRWVNRDQASHSWHPQSLQNRRSATSSVRTASRTQDQAQQSSTNPRTYATAPEILRALPVGASYQAADAKDHPQSLPPKKAASSTSRSGRTGQSITGRYFRHRFYSVFRRLRQRRLERREAKYKDKYDKLARKMQDKHDAIDLRHTNSRSKIKRRRARKITREQQRRDKRAHTRQKLRRKRERAWSSAEGRNDSDDLSVNGIHTRDFAVKGER